MTTVLVTVPKTLLGWLFTRQSGALRPASVVLWWEARRVPYNIIVGLVGLVTATVMVTTAFICETRGGAPIGLPDPPALALVGVLVYGVLANICYTGGWITELLVARFWSVDTARFGPIALMLGLGLSVLVTLALAGLVFAAAAMTSCGRWMSPTGPPS